MCCRPRSTAVTGGYGNHYYVTLRDSNVLVFKRMVDGVYTEMNAQALDVVAGRPIHLRLQSSGSLHTVYVDGR